MIRKALSTEWQTFELDGLADSRHHAGMPSDWISPPTYSPFRIDLWTDERRSIDRELALVQDLDLAHACFEAAVRAWPGREVTMRQVTRLMRTSRPRS